MRQIYQARDVSEAQMIVNELAQHGIACKILRGTIPMGEPANAWPEVWVDEARDDQARGVLNGFLQRTQQASESETTCPDCGESSPGNFELCWNCGAELPT